LITDDFNAAVVQIPRLGLLGWYRNTLLIGLPLMKALTRQQLAAVLAHEFGHLAGGHGRLGNWVYRLRFGWARLAQGAARPALARQLCVCSILQMVRALFQRGLVPARACQ